MFNRLISHLSLRNQSNLVIFFVSLLLLISSAALLLQINHAANDWDTYQTRVMHKERLLSEIKTSFGYGGAIHHFKDYQLAADSRDQQRAIDNFSKLNQQLSQYQALSGLNQTETDAITAIKQVTGHYMAGLQLVEQLIAQGKKSQTIYDAVKIDDSAALQALAQLDGAFQQLNTQQNTQFHALFSSSKTRLIFTTLSCLLVLLAGIKLLISPIIRALNALSHDIDTLLGCDKQALGQSLNEVTVLRASVREIISNLTDILATVTQSAAGMSREVSFQQDLVASTGAGVAKQHQELTQLTSAMTEMSATAHEIASNISDVADNANQVNETAKKNGDTIRLTKVTINALYSRMSEGSRVIAQLDEDSQSIGSVLDVINSIAEQTNLLALNAAIEAARAGEQGRGFAVVADEVRALASRTAESTGEIRNMITRVQQQVQQTVQNMTQNMEDAQQCTEYAESADVQLEAIVAAIDSISDMTTQIATAAEQQSLVSEDMNRNVLNIDAVALETADSSKHTELAALNVGDFVGKLHSDISQFNLSDTLYNLKLAKAAHSGWVTRLRAYLDGKSMIRLAEATSHKACGLGKWYFGEGLQNFKHLAEMGELDSPHDKFHQCVCNIIEANEKGDKTCAEKEFATLTALSVNVIGLLDDIQTHVESDAQKTA